MQVGNRDGIPDTLTIDFIKEWVRPRVSDKRFKHIKGVVEVAIDLADKAHVDSYKAQLAAWLHDACKEMKPRDLVDRARQANIFLTDIEVQQGHLLHGPVAAAVAKAELQLTNAEVLMAIAEHTLGGTPMSELSKVIFLADCLDETRSEDYTTPIWKALDVNRAFDMNTAIVVACDLGIQHIIESGKPIHPKTIAVRNYYLDIVKTKQNK